MEVLCGRLQAPTPAGAFVLSYQQCENLAKGNSTALQVIALSRRTPKKLFQPSFPKDRLVRAYIKQQTHAEQCMGESTAMGTSKELYELPAGIAEFPAQSHTFGKEDYQTQDAVAFLKFMKFSSHLRDQKDGDEALADCIDFACHDNSDLHESVTQSCPSAPKRTALQRGRLRLDATAMLVDQREFMHMYTHEPNSLESCHLFSDGSPVTGTELQGMVLQLCMANGEIRSLVTPGVCLHHGGYGVSDKLFAFLWSLHLLTGPNMVLMSWLLENLKSITTDMGTELALTDQPNVLPQFIMWRAGVSLDKLRSTVDRSSRIFPKTT
jgi:hypothetical protein